MTCMGTISTVFKLGESREGCTYKGMRLCRGMKVSSTTAELYFRVDGIVGPRSCCVVMSIQNLPVIRPFPVLPYRTSIWLGLYSHFMPRKGALGRLTLPSVSGCRAPLVWGWAIILTSDWCQKGHVQFWLLREVCRSLGSTFPKEGATGSRSVCRGLSFSGPKRGSVEPRLPVAALLRRRREQPQKVAHTVHVRVEGSLNLPTAWPWLCSSRMWASKCAWCLCYFGLSFPLFCRWKYSNSTI